MSHASQCRALAQRARSATLSTMARDPEGFPFGTLVAIAFDERGRPLLLLSTLAEHTANLAACDRASVMIYDTEAAEAVVAERMTLVGPCTRVPAEDVAEARTTYLAAHPSASQYVSFADFALFRLDPLAVRYVGGFGKMSWVDVDAYRRGI